MLANTDIRGKSCKWRPEIVRSLVVCLHQIVGVNLPASHLARSALGASPFGLAQLAYSLRALRSLFAGLQIEIFPKVFPDFTKNIDEFSRTGIDQSFCVRLRRLKKQKT